jgi:hypothetical protein
VTNLVLKVGKKNKKRKMTILPHTQEMINEAKEWAKELGSLNNSITSGKGNAAGRVGELALAKYLNVKTPSDKYNHDIKYDGKTIEVKTKRRIIAPKNHYDVSIAKTSNHQKPDRYAFVSLEFKKSGYYGKPAEGLQRKGGKQYSGLINVWYCGDISYDKFWETAELWKKGRTDSSNDFTTLVDMYNLPISQLDETLVEDKDVFGF